MALTTEDAVPVVVTVAATNTIENAKLKMENEGSRDLGFPFLLYLKF